MAEEFRVTESSIVSLRDDQIQTTFLVDSPSLDTSGFNHQDLTEQPKEPKHISIRTSSLEKDTVETMQTPMQNPN